MYNLYQEKERTMEKSELILTREQKAYIEAHTGELEDLVLRLARIPAPTGKEEKRAQFCLNWLHKNGAETAYIDQAGNVVYAYGQRETECAEQPVWVFMAHMDVVFSDETELPLREQDDRIYCPGIGDNTVNLAVLLMMAKYVAQYHPDTKGKLLLFVCDVGEEGLGNLKGVREICRAFHQTSEEKNCIERFYALDLGYDTYTCRAVGSLRYRIQVKTKGGHSYGDFGNTNAIAVLAELIQKLYEVEVSRRGKTTYNVGMVSGGTSINSIAQQAELMYEIRSDDAEDLAEMQRKFEKTIAWCREKYSIRNDDILENQETERDMLSDKKVLSEVRLQNQAELILEKIGERPCESGVNEGQRKQMFEQVETIVKIVTGNRPAPVPCSTDCNIPLSMGIPSVCVGTCLGAGFHTREEWIEKASLKNGFEIGMALVCFS